MKQEDKQLLLIDLSARLPYKVKGVYARTDIKNLSICEITAHLYGEMEESFNGKEKYEFIPYLRPMSSMTDEEKREVGKLGVCVDGAFHNDIYDIGISMEEAFTAISWFLERHFDINYLIEKGLALEAPEDMYKQ